MKRKQFSEKKRKPVILALIMLITCIVTIISINVTKASAVNTTMGVATLPIVMMKTDKGNLFNQLHGYTLEIDASIINNSVTPLPNDKKLSVVINTYGEEVENISYKIRKFSDMSLIEDTKVTGYTSNENTIDAVLNIKNLIENDTEYLLEIQLATANHQSIYYYTKIINSVDLGLQEKIDFVLEFNECTFDTDRLDTITQWIEPKASADNSNFGKVNINSSKSQIGWGELSPTVEKTIIPTVKDITSEVASIFLEYQMVSQNELGAYDTYNVEEYYRIRQSGTSMYLLNYEREANQVFDSKNDLTQTARINFGITSNTDVEMKASDNGKYSCFVRQGELWQYYDTDNIFTRVFSFASDAFDNVREAYNQHDIKIMSVEDNGNVNFIVYGYMNRGEHEGSVGVSLCMYNYDENNVEETLYIPVAVPYNVLEENVGHVAYISSINNRFYILLNDTLYSIDLESKEKMIEVSNLTDGTYAVSVDGTQIAYSVNGKVNDTDTIRVFNMADGTDYQIRAAEGDAIKAIGYIKNDFVYGIAHKSDVLIEDNGTVTFPMYRIEIIDTSYNLIKDYMNEGIYVSEASVSGMRLNLTRVVKNDAGGYEGTSIDQLINRDESSEDGRLKLETFMTDNRKTELYITLNNKVSSIDRASMRASRELVFAGGEAIKSDESFNDLGRYYVYGYGKFQGSFTSLDKAISLASEKYGTVIDSDSNYIWKKYKISNASVNQSDIRNNGTALEAAITTILASSGIDVDASAQMAAGKNAIDIINDATGGKALNLKGVTLENALYYINVGIPVIGRIANDNYALITAYDSKNITYYDMNSGKQIKSTIAEASKLFTQWENVFISYFR